jgi:hypothetical protein
MNKLTVGSGALSIVLALVLPAAQAVAQDGDAPPLGNPIIAGMGGFAGTGGFTGAGGMGPIFQDLRVVNAGAGIPIDGGLLIQSGTGSQPIVAIADSATPSTTLGGTVTQIDLTGYWVWVPTLPLTVGTFYNVSLSAPDLGISGITDTFEAVAAVTIERPTITTEPSVSSVSETNTFSCCRSLQGGFLNDSSCFPSEQRRSAMLDPGFTTSDPAVLLNQFVFRMGAGTGSAATAPPYAWSSLTPMWFTTQATEYCFEIEAIEIVARTVFTYEELETCAPHGDLAELGVVAVVPGAAELDHLVCQAPPTQYEDQWCELNEDPCAEDAMQTACGLYGFVCRGEPLPEDPFSMAGGFAGMFGTSGTSGGFGAVGGVGGAGSSGNSGEGGAAGMSEDDDPVDVLSEPAGNDGCSVVEAKHARSTRSALTWCIALAALVLVKRRRR